MIVHKHPVPEAFAANAVVKAADYQALYQESVKDPEGFWSRIAKRIDWLRFPTRIKDVSFDPAEFRVRWFEDGELNVSVNCLDRQLAARGDKIALLFEGDDPAVSKSVTYRELHEQVCRFGNALRRLGVKKGDRVTIYMPMIPEAAIAMLACARIGAVHSVVFGGFSPDSLAGRIEDCTSTIVITADEGVRGGKRIPLKANVDAAISTRKLAVKSVVVVRRTGQGGDWIAGRDHRYEELVAAESSVCFPERMNAEDPLFILYTSGSTGKPKGVLHTGGGYLVYVNFTFACVFDYREDDVFWCTADVGWVTGHSYIVYGPLSNGATSLMFEGVPNYPDTSRFWRVVDKHKVTIFYTAPTAIRALMRDGDAPVKATSRASLRLLGTVGEPINPEAWEWYHRVVGDGRCPIVDTWWQTETGGILISPLPGATLEGGLGDTAIARHACQRSSTTKAAFSKAPPRAISSCSTAGPGRCARSMATTSATSIPTSRPSAASTSLATARVATRTATGGSRAASMTSSMSPAIALARPKSRARSSRTRKSPKRRSSAARTRSRARASTPMSR